jgi:hypothetical protein
MFNHTTTPADGAAAALAALNALVREKRGRGLDLDSLLALRHLSRLYSFRCGGVGIAPAIELESRAAELHAESCKASPELAFLERRVDKLLGQMHAALRGAIGTMSAGRVQA